MLPEKLKLEIATPERLVLSEGVDEVILPSAEGYMGVRPGHAPLMAQLDVGEISYRERDEQKYLACSGGFVEVLPDRVSVLAETAEPADEIDLERAQRAREKAEEQIRAESSEHETLRAEVRLKKAVSRIQVRSRVK